MHAHACGGVHMCFWPNPRQKKGSCCNHVLSTLTQLPQWSCQYSGDPRYLQLILACDSLKASATLISTRLLCPHSVHLVKNQCPNLFPARKHLKQSGGLTVFWKITPTDPRPPSPRICVLLLPTACSEALLPASQLSPLPLQAGCELERVTRISKNISWIGGEGSWWKSILYEANLFPSSSRLGGSITCNSFTQISGWRI